MILRILRLSFLELFELEGWECILPEDEFGRFSCQTFSRVSRKKVLNCGYTSSTEQIPLDMLIKGSFFQKAHGVESLNRNS